MAALRKSFDSVHGGWGGAPKFPQASVIEFLLARDEQPMALQTLRSMAGGGIFDQVGGGFSRYSVDARWTVPHFEKMLYDNALLARAYLHGFQASGDALLRRTAEETLDWALREMRAPEGGFYSALDADSEGVEGRFYVWSVDELRAALGDDADAAIAWFGATEARQLRGRQHPRVARARAAAGAARAHPRDPAGRARAARAPGPRRQAPGGLERADDRRAGRCRRRARPRGLPRRRARRRRVRARADARARRPAAAHLQRRRRAKLGAYLEDHAFLLEALLVLYEATFEERWFIEARALADTIVARFADPERGGFFSTADDHEALIARRKDLEDTPIPAGGSAAALRPAAPRRADRRARLRGAGGRAARACCTSSPCAIPNAFGHLLQALDLYLAPRREVALAGDPAGVAALAAVVREARRPHLVLAAGPGDGADRRGAHGAAHAGRRPRRGLRVRALRLPHAGHRARRARARCCDVLGAGVGATCDICRVKPRDAVVVAAVADARGPEPARPPRC